VPNILEIPLDKVQRTRQEGESFNKAILEVFDATTSTLQKDRIMTGESDGTLRVMNVGKDGSNIIQMELEATGEQKTVLYGKDSDSNLDAFRTNANQQQQIEIINPLGGPTVGILGTSSPNSGTNTLLFTVAANTSTQMTMLTVCNRSSSIAKIRVGIDVGGNGSITPSNAEWLYYDLELDPNSTILLDVAQGMWLAALDDIVVYSNNSSISFIASGVDYV